MSKSRFAALACLLLVAVILVAIPTAAMGAIGAAKWSVPVYQGVDNFYGGANVVAFEAGTTANVTVPVTNDQGVDVTIREASIWLDWNQTYTGTFPATMKNGETANFTFAVAIPAGVSNAVLHTYQVKVGYQRQDQSSIVTYRAGELAGTGDGATQNFDTDFAPVLQTSLKVSWVTGTTIEVKDGSTFTVNARTGRITFGTAPPAGTQVWVDYQYFQTLAVPDGVRTVFFTGTSPVVEGTLQVYVGNATKDTFVAVTPTAVDYETGKITLPSAPTTFERVYATYEQWTRWPIVAAGNLAVYSADQADAMILAQQYNALLANAPAFWLPGPQSTAGAQARADALVAAADANVKYAAGDFAAAEAQYQAAIDKLKAAFAANSTLSTTAEQAITALVQNAAPVVDAYANKLDAEAKSAEGQGSMYKNVGVFSILLGVATLLAGIGGILWAYSRLVEARGPKQAS